MTFFGKSRLDAKTDKHVHESPMSMMVPLVVLALGALLAGFLGLPGKLGVIQSFLEPVFGRANEVLGLEEHHLGAVDYVLMAVSLVVAMSGIALAWVMYVRRKDLPGLVGSKLRLVYKVVYNKFYIDEFYGATFVRATVDGSRWVWRQFDEKIIDGAVNGTAAVWQWAGRTVRPLQTGKVQNYLLGMFVGLFVIVTVVVFL